MKNIYPGLLQVDPVKYDDITFNLQDNLLIFEDQNCRWN